MTDTELATVIYEELKRQNHDPKMGSLYLYNTEGADDTEDPDFTGIGVDGEVDLIAIAAAINAASHKSEPPESQTPAR